MSTGDLNVYTATGIIMIGVKTNNQEFGGKFYIVVFWGTKTSHDNL